MSNARSDRASGWNGSLVPYVHEHRQSAPCPANVRAKLEALREQAVTRIRGKPRPGTMAPAADTAEMRGPPPASEDSGLQGDVV